MQNSFGVFYKIITILRLLLLHKLTFVIELESFQTFYLLQIWVHSLQIIQEKIQYLLINFVWPGEIEKLHVTSSVTHVVWVWKIAQPNSSQVYPNQFPFVKEIMLSGYTQIPQMGWLSLFSSVQFSHSVVSDSLRPHELQHARPPVHPQGVGDGQGSLACCSSWGHKELDRTKQLNWTELNKESHPIWGIWV